MERFKEQAKMISHIERPILASALMKISTSTAMMDSDRSFIFSIIEEINQNRNVIELDPDNKDALIDILNKHLCQNITTMH